VPRSPQRAHEGQRRSLLPIGHENGVHFHEFIGRGVPPSGG
jgi:hypothetical protein